MDQSAEFAKIMLENDMDENLQEVKNAARFKNERPRTLDDTEYESMSRLDGSVSKRSKTYGDSIKKSLIAAAICAVVIIGLVIINM